jgi:hypothetical protein
VRIGCPSSEGFRVQEPPADLEIGEKVHDSVKRLHLQHSIRPTLLATGRGGWDVNLLGLDKATRATGRKERPLCVPMAACWLVAGVGWGYAPAVVARHFDRKLTHSGIRCHELRTGGLPGLPQGRVLQRKLQIRAHHPGRRLRLAGNLPCISHPGRRVSAGARAAERRTRLPLRQFRSSYGAAERLASAPAPVR